MAPSGHSVKEVHSSEGPLEWKLVLTFALLIMGRQYILERDLLFLLMADLGPLHRSWPRKFPSLPGCSLEERLITSLAPLYSSVSTTA